MTAWWYWALVILFALVVFGGFPLASWLEQRQDDRDRELWESMWR